MPGSGEDLDHVLSDIAGRGWPLFQEGTAIEAATDALHDAGLGDGLPLVPPTVRRLDAMLAGVWHGGHGLAPAGRVPPLMGELSAGAVAYNAILAGCRPAELRVVSEAAAATLEPPFKLLELQATTGSAAVALLVHGPVVDALSMNAGSNCLGPGNRANACIGRALHLVLAHVGGAHPGTIDLATLGQPGKYVFCCAEGTHPALPSLHVRRGLADVQSAVTVLGVSGMTEALPAERLPMPDTLIEPLARAVCGAEAAAGNDQAAMESEYMVILPPTAWERLGLSGVGWRAFNAMLEARCRALAPFGRRTVHLLCAGGIGEKMLCLHPWSGGSLSVTRRLATS